MALLRVPYGETVTLTDVVRDASDDTVTPGVTIANTVFARIRSASMEEAQRGRRTVVERNWFCPRSAVVHDGQRITRSNGETYSIISDAHGDVDHPMTGHDFGYKKYRVRRVITPRG